MLKITKSVEYALIAINYMEGHKKDAILSAKKISNACVIPPELLAKILQKLSSIDMMNSIKGPKGGYQLNDKINDINIYDLIEVIDGPVSLIDCNRSKKCNLLDFCKIKAPLMKVNDKIVDTLKSITLDQIK